jgi:hypothetical protein
LLTSAGAYFTNYTQCIADADRLSERYTRISREVLAREQAFADGVARATTIDEVLRTAKSYPSMYSDLASRSLVDLQSELLAISRKISAGPGFEHLSDELFPNGAELLFDGRLYRLRYGDTTVTLADSDLPEIKKSVAYNYQTIRKIGQLEALQVLSSNCSVSNTVGAMLGYRTKNLRADAADSGADWVRFYLQHKIGPQQPAIGKE